jgi:hypothetical protein
MTQDLAQEILKFIIIKPQLAKEVREHFIKKRFF